MSLATVLTVEHENGTGPGQFRDRLTAAGLTVDLRRPWAGDPLPLDLDRHDGLLVLGGSMGPYDDERAPWLPGVRRLLLQAVDRDLPTLGICLGMELLTAACGGEVRHSEHPEIGLCDLTVLGPAAADPLFRPLTVPDAPLQAVQWHVEETVRLPEGAQPLLTSERCEHQAYRIGTAVWGVQFHPEALTAGIRDWAPSDSGLLRACGLSPQAVLAEVTEREPRLRAVWGAFADRWAAIVADHRSTTPTIAGNPTALLPRPRRYGR